MEGTAAVPAETSMTGNRPGMLDLKTRFVSGLALAAAALWLTWLGVWPFALLVLVFALVVAWEWGRVVRDVEFDVIFAAHAGAVTLAVVLAAAGLPILGVVAVATGAILALLLAFSQAGSVSAFGVLYSGLPAIALIWLRSAGLLGLEAALFVLLVVWSSDIGAYFAGRTIGGPKLMPKVSPNKTWSGLAGAVLAAVAMAGLMGLVFKGLLPSQLIPNAICLALVAQAGDLMESALKRRHGIKDASNLIPGHGGFMDRVDGLIAAAIAAGIYAAVSNVKNPAAVVLGVL